MTVPPLAPRSGASPSAPSVPVTPAREGPDRHVELADLVRAAVLGVPGVADMHTGTFGEVATYLPGRRVDGVRIRPDVTEVHVVVTWGSPVLLVADELRAAIEPLVGTPVDVSIQDVVAQGSHSGRELR